ncbi:toxin-antitoxin system, toxin component [Streptacidiphilus sp. PB12-B1b]|uniref:LppU/SCO3897 family protein n=1 Tax=Streptacidiphilus sp. PB12-B1b TaxID=2705012 RepID=UPI0015FD894A|nr:toxin-antitoxin system, toxin component [Streptacidiphilus sp. PB12-B1b]QMU78946.1 toxin-antitoxin system, toxin component [Streptacidiphilus sp. PB12-B1b]
MTTPPQPVAGNPYAQPAAGNPYADRAQAPAPANPYAPPYPPQQPPLPPQPPYAQQPPHPQQPAQAPFAPPQQPYPPQPYPQQSYPGPQSGVGCRFCGAQPAVEATVRAHRGMVLMMQWRTQHGPFCRTCGVASVRKLTADTLIQGWWGLQSFFRTPVTLVQNALAYRRIKALPEPAPGRPGQPLELGRPLLARPGAIGLLVPVAVVALVVAGITASSSDPSYASVGSCVQNHGTSDNPDVSVVTCAPGTYKVIDKLGDTTDDSGCPQPTTVSYTQQESGDDFVLCLEPYSS